MILLSHSRIMALNLQVFKQAPQRIHLSQSILNGFFTVPEMAPTGQILEHAEQPLHLSYNIVYLNMALHSPARHLCSFICSTYSSRKYCNVDKTGFGAVCPKPHKEFSLM